VEADDLDALVEAMAPQLVLDAPTALILNPNWLTSRSDEMRIVDAIQVRETGAIMSQELEDWSWAMRDSVEYTSSYGGRFPQLGVSVYIGEYRDDDDPWWWVQWEALSIDGHHRFLSYNDDSRWEQVWASFGFTNVESRTSGYWSHTVGLVASGIAAIARDEDMERRTVELLHVDDTSPEDVVHLIWSVESNFSELRFPEELTQAYKDGNPLDSFQTEGGFEWHLTLSVSEEVLSLL
jgi:hypothetical protein